MALLAARPSSDHQVLIPFDTIIHLNYLFHCGLWLRLARHRTGVVQTPTYDHHDS